MTEFIKVCGITNVDDASMVAEAGVDAIGLNLISVSPRCITAEEARTISRAVRGHVKTVALVDSYEVERLEQVRQTAEVDWVQVHGAFESVSSVPPWVFFAMGISSAADAVRAGECPGEMLLVDAKVPGMLGGTGVVFDWRLVQQLAGERQLILAGGLGPDNVAEAVALVRPWGVDVASGVQAKGNPRRKDAGRVRAFVEAVRHATQKLGLRPEAR